MINDNLPNVFRCLIAQTIEATSPTDIVLGEVIAISPLSIKTATKEIIDEDFIMLTDSVRDYSVDIEVNHVTEPKGGGGGYASYASHTHGYKGRKKIMVYNSLKVGEKVIMIKQKGGQLFIVLCRVFDHMGLSGQWG